MSARPGGRSSGRGGVLGRLVVRRLLLAIPTLFGISLVTFALVNLAPGEPGAGAGSGAAGWRSTAVTREAAENLRRTYGLDLPLFLNFDVQDRGKRVRRSLRELDRPATAALAEQRLVTAGTLTLDELVADLREAAPRRRVVLLRVLGKILEAMGEPERRAVLAGGPEAVHAWWRRHRSDFQPSVIRAAVQRLEAGAPFKPGEPGATVS